MTCLFCKIIQGEIPGNILYEDNDVIALRDISPQAPTHCLVIPKRHIATMNDLAPEDTHLIGHIVQTAKALAQSEGIAEKGYRLVWNVNQDGGQAVYHIHLHVLGGRAMHWPPG